MRATIAFRIASRIAGFAAFAPLAAFIAVAAAGCGDDAAPPLTLDMTAAADLSMPPPPDLTIPIDLAPYPDLSPYLGVGLPCPKGDECMAGLFCLGQKLDPGLPAEGVCTMKCVNDPECGANSFCGPPMDGVGNLCWLRCGPNDTCASPRQVCGRRFGGYIDLVNKACLPGNSGARDGSPCKNFGDCNRNQACVNNPFDFPGGLCVTVGCSTFDNSTCAPGGMPVCLKADNVNLCFASCNIDGDCRINEGYRCVQPPNTAEKVCLFNNPLGGNCKMPKDCNGGPPWSCIVDNNLPNGYCSIIGCDAKMDRGCPSNGHCLDVGGGTTVCLKGCSDNGECAPGTSCKPLTLGNGAMAKVCVP